MFLEAVRFIGRMESRQTMIVSTSAAGWDAQMPFTPNARGSTMMNGM